MLQEIYAGIEFNKDGVRFGFFNADGGCVGKEMVVKHCGDKITNEDLASELANGVAQLWEKLREQRWDGNSRMLGAIGVSGSGPLNSRRGILTKPASLPKIMDLHIGSILQKKFGVQVFLLDRSEAAAIGEHAFGAGKGMKDLVLLTLDAEIGSGVISQGRLQRGMGRGGQWAHVAIGVFGKQPRFCVCGQSGCLESYAGLNGLYQTALDCCRHSEAWHGDEIIVEHLRWNAKETVVNLVQGVGTKCKLCLEIFGQYSGHLALAVGNIISVHHPEAVILEGYVSRIGQPLADAVKKHLKNMKDPNKMFAEVQIKCSELFNGSMAGAAKYAVGAKTVYIRSKER